MPSGPISEKQYQVHSYGFSSMTLKLYAMAPTADYYFHVPIIFSTFVRSLLLKV